MNRRQALSAGTPRQFGVSRSLQYAVLASPHIPIAAMALSMSVFVPQYYAAATPISLAGVGLAFSVVRLVDMLFDPMLGIAVDRVKSRFGRFRPWVVLGAPAAMIGVAITYFPSADATFANLLLGLVFYYAGQSLLTVSTFAWAALLADSAAGRAKLYGWIQSASMLGMLLALAMLPVLRLYVRDSKVIAVHGMGILILLTAPLAVAAVAAFVTEPTEAAAFDRQPFLGALLEYGRLLRRTDALRIISNTFFYALASGVSGSLALFFAADKGLGAQFGLLLLVYFGAAFVASRIWTPLTKRFGKYTLLSALCGCAVLVQLGTLFLPQRALTWAGLGQVILGVTYSGMLVLQRAALGDIADDIRHEHADVTGRLYAFYAFVTKFGNAGAIGLTFPILQWIGFTAKAGAANSPVALHRMELTFVLFPALLLAAAGLSVVGGDKKRGQTNQA